MLVPSWQQLPNVTSQRPVQQPMVATDSLTTQGMPDSWRRSLMVDNFDQASSIIPMVTKSDFLFSHGEILFSLFLFPLIQHPTKECRSIVRDESSVYFNVTAKHV